MQIIQGLNVAHHVAEAQVSRARVLKTVAFSRVLNLGLLRIFIFSSNGIYWHYAALWLVEGDWIACWISIWRDLIWTNLCGPVCWNEHECVLFDHESSCDRKNGTLLSSVGIFRYPFHLSLIMSSEGGVEMCVWPRSHRERKCSIPILVKSLGVQDIRTQQCEVEQVFGAAYPK